MEDDRIEALARGLTDEGIFVGRGEDDLKSLRHLLQRIGRFKRDLIPSSAVGAESEEEGIAKLDVAYAAYDRTLRIYNAVDFDDLLGLTYRLFTEAPRVARHYRRMYRYILVDEAQDTSRAQYEVLKSLCGSEHRNVMMVADADQYIYRFAGASDQFIRQFRNDFGAVEYRLSLNFRCASVIVEAANALIQNNCDRLAPDAFMRSECNAEGMVTAASYANESFEAKGTADLVLELLERGLAREWLHPTEETHLEAQEICILGRNRYLLGATVEELERRGIPFRFGTTEHELFESPFFRTVYYSLRVLLNFRDLLSRRNLLAAVGIDNGAADEFLGSDLADLFLLIGQRSASHQANLMDVLRDTALRAPSLEEIVERIIGYGKVVSEASAEEGDKALVVSDMKNFRERWRSYRQRIEKPEWSLQSFLGELSLSSRSSVEGAGVHVLTVHAAKGLEYRAVILVGMNEGSFPDFRSSKSKESLEEERRNAYVAVTRASRRLHLARPRNRLMPWGDERVQTESRFLREMNITVESLD